LLQSTIHDLLGPEPRDEWCLFLDVDGTLLEIAPTPDAVHVDSGLVELLERVQSALGGAVALVSGRSIATVDTLFAPLRWPVAGLHGLERRDAAGALHTAVARNAELAGVRRELAELAAHLPGVLLEDKGQSIALHYRAAPEHEPALRRAMRSLARRLGDEYHLLEGKMVLELKPSVATKAEAIRAYLGEPPFAGRRPIFVGDDVTDLDGFAAVDGAGGLSIAVGDRVEARARLESPREVRALLARLAELAGLPA